MLGYILRNKDRKELFLVEPFTTAQTVPSSAFFRNSRNQQRAFGKAGIQFVSTWLFAGGCTISNIIVLHCTSVGFEMQKFALSIAGSEGVLTSEFKRLIGGRENAATSRHAYRNVSTSEVATLPASSRVKRSWKTGNPKECCDHPKGYLQRQHVLDGIFMRP